MKEKIAEKLWVKAEHLAPPGTDLAKIRAWYFVLLGACACAMFIQFISTWNVAHNNLYEWTASGRVMRAGAMLPSFLVLIWNTHRWFLAVVAYLVFELIENYVCYYRGSKSIYVMKRLPSRMEIHKRAWSLPVIGLIGVGIMIALTMLLCLLIYLLCSPARCLPEHWLIG